MKDHVIIVPSDGMIIVNDIVMKSPFAAPADLHAIQWHNGKGEIEYTDARPNLHIEGEADYNKYVASYVNHWQIAFDQSTLPPSPEELNQLRIKEIQRQLELLDTASIRPLRALADGTATSVETDKLAELEQQASALRAELSTLLQQQQTW